MSGMRTVAQWIGLELSFSLKGRFKRRLWIECKRDVFERGCNDWDMPPNVRWCRILLVGGFSSSFELIHKKSHYGQDFWVNNKKEKKIITVLDNSTSVEFDSTVAHAVSVILSNLRIAFLISEEFGFLRSPLWKGLKGFPSFDKSMDKKIMTIDIAFHESCFPRFAYLTLHLLLALLFQSVRKCTWIQTTKCSIHWHSQFLSFVRDGPEWME